MMQAAPHIRDAITEQGGVVPGPVRQDVYGDGSSNGYGYGDGDGSGIDNGYGYGNGKGNGSSYRNGDGSGNGIGNGTGDGYGDRNGDSYDQPHHTPLTEGDMVTDRADLPSTHSPYIITIRERAFFGYVDMSKFRAEGGVSYITDIRRATNTLRWGAYGGVERLANQGPGPEGRISDRADIAILTGVVALRECSPAAVERYESMTPVSS